MTPTGPEFEPVGQRARRLTRPIWKRAVVALKLAQVRLRLPIVLIVAALVVGRWELIRNYWDRMAGGTLSESTIGVG